MTYLEAPESKAFQGLSSLSVATKRANLKPQIKSVGKTSRGRIKYRVSVGSKQIGAITGAGNNSSQKESCLEQFRRSDFIGDRGIFNRCDQEIKSKSNRVFENLKPWGTGAIASVENIYLF